MSQYKHAGDITEERRPLERSRRRWEDNTKIYLRKMESGSTNWIDLAQDLDRWRVVMTDVMNLPVP